MEMDNSLKEALRNILNLAYPEEWATAWLSLPLETEGGRSPFNFQVICSDLPFIRQGKSSWPPASRDPKVWLRWEPSPGTGFWIRPRKYDPLLRDRLILLEPNEIVDVLREPTIRRQALLDACLFAALSGRIVWHNPPKGGARLPQSGHFQSMPVYWQDGDTLRYTFPCCIYQAEDAPWTSAQDVHVRLLEGGVGRNQYPILGLVVWGSIRATVDRVWEVIWHYDEARACNLVIQPGDVSSYQDVIRVFVFPRSRDVPHYTVTERLLKDDEKILMRNNHSGKWAEWSFAGVEMGLLTQADWGEVFEDMQAKTEKWGKTLLRLLQKLTLNESERDWHDFRDIVQHYC